MVKLRRNHQSSGNGALILKLLLTILVVIAMIVGMIYLT